LLRRTLNLGIVAHVDAGKTTLTERLLYAAGLIDEVGSVDKGTTQTDALPLEQQRGITIRAAVVSFPIGDVTVNLIDTPGHPDFIAEVDRSLSVLDGAVLVVSAVEGVQPQTRLLTRALERLGIPTLIFVNKMDRAGADPERVLEEIGERLTPSALVIESAEDAAFAQEYAAQGTPVYPVFFGSARTGDGVDELRAGLVELLPSSTGAPDGPPAGMVFKIERGPGGEKIAYVRMFSGALRTRDRVRFGRNGEAKVTDLAVFAHGATAVRGPSVAAGEIAKVWGLADIQVGDPIGPAGRRSVRHEFAAPTLESVVAPLDPDDRQRLHVALGELAEQDPLINVRQDDTRQELSISLYGEVQKEVIQALLADEYGLEVEFRETTPIYVERPLRPGEALEVLNADSNPYSATIGLRVDPAPEDSGASFRLDIDTRTIPLQFFKSPDAFAESMDEYVRAALEEGRFGWRVTDCVVTMTECGYAASDGPPSKRGPASTPAEYRRLTPLVLAQALERAGTTVCEPVVRARIEVPVDTIGAVIAALGRLGAEFEVAEPESPQATIEAVLAAVLADELQRELPRLTHGKGVLDSSFAGYRPVSGEPPSR
jgi:ribosomal protection tetracycline resistance protein